MIVDLDKPVTWTYAQPPVSTFTEYAREFLAHAHEVRRIQQFLANQRAAIAAGRRAADQMPRPDDWRVYRFCSQNVVIAMPLLRFDRNMQALVVGACPITELSQLDPDAPARAVCTLLFSEAYRAGGDLTVHFAAGVGRNAEPAPIPYPLMRWAGRCGVKLDRQSGVIDAESAQTLFLSSGEFSDGMRRRLSELSPGGLAAVCFGVASGTWSAPAAEAILAWAEGPAAILRGDSNPLERARYALDLLEARSALMLATLVTRVGAGSGMSSLDAEDSEQPVNLTVLPNRCAVVAARDIQLMDWWVPGSAPPPISDFHVQVVDAEHDQLIEALAAAVRAAPEGRVLLCPKDLHSLSSMAMAEVLESARLRNVVVLSGPEYTTTIALRAADALSRAAGARL
ncbi:hypothetical protein SBI67_14305 [Mycolicibacterium sp. 120266]|uniref:hypothetical protein n=1 Tax=Mycolicibacterium sp. 120266 TaxID=3090601 RepID=UPI00299F2274|nr:hypothetical protein [Mycolicibacterium sp. 120266]MDX1873293.1 hypothetical protein [Mycolicibacterium sp. 120266]